MLCLDAVYSRGSASGTRTPVLSAFLAGSILPGKSAPGYAFPFLYHSLEAETCRSWVQRALWWLFSSTVLVPGSQILSPGDPVFFPWLGKIGESKPSVYGS